MNTKPKMCPENSIALKNIDYEGMKVDQCPLCGGIWCDAGKLDEIIKKRLQKFDLETISSVKELNLPSLQLATGKVKLKARKCLMCDENMVKSDYSPKIKISVDRCSLGHGIWLDENELERIQILVENEK